MIQTEHVSNSNEIKTNLTIYSLALLVKFKNEGYWEGGYYDDDDDHDDGDYYDHYDYDDYIDDDDDDFDYFSGMIINIMMMILL